MPVKRGKDSKGSFYKFGDSGKKYYYNTKNKESRERAKKSATEQEQAAYASGYNGN